MLYRNENEQTKNENFDKIITENFCQWKAGIKAKKLHFLNLLN
jgi:hypothetical protein